MFQEPSPRLADMLKKTYGRIILGDYNPDLASPISPEHVDYIMNSFFEPNREGLTHPALLNHCDDLFLLDGRYSLKFSGQSTTPFTFEGLGLFFLHNQKNNQLRITPDIEDKFGVQIILNTSEVYVHPFLTKSVDAFGYYIQDRTSNEKVGEFAIRAPEKSTHFFFVPKKS